SAVLRAETIAYERAGSDRRPTGGQQDQLAMAVSVKAVLWLAKHTGLESMTVERYADYLRELRTLFAELDKQPDRFQTFHVHIELAAAGKLVVYEKTKRKGQ